MTLVFFRVLTGIAALALLAAGAGAAAESPSAAQKCYLATGCGPANDLYLRMTRVNAKIKTYKADVHVNVQMHSFPYISPALDGNVYFKQPNKEAVVFDTVPALASQLKKVYPKLDLPPDWPKLYEITPLGDEAGTTTFRLIPRKNGRVEHLDVKVDDATATVKAYTWTYKDGGFVTFDQSYKTVNGNYLLDRQAGKVDLPSYKADIASAFSNYKLNVAIADDVFVEK